MYWQIVVSSLIRNMFLNANSQHNFSNQMVQLEIHDWDMWVHYDQGQQNEIAELKNEKQLLACVKKVAQIRLNFS